MQNGIIGLGEIVPELSAKGRVITSLASFLSHWFCIGIIEEKLQDTSCY